MTIAELTDLCQEKVFSAQRPYCQKSLKKKFNTKQD